MSRKEEREEEREGGRERERKRGRKKTHSIQIIAQNGCNRSIIVTSRWWFTCVALYFIIYIYTHTYTPQLQSHSLEQAV